MRIGIYKPFKKVFFVDDKEDNAAWSYEVVHVANILKERGNEVFMLSESDIPEAGHEGVFTGKMDEKYDRVILFSGSFNLDPAGDNIIEKLRELTPRLDFLLTDLRLVPSDKELYKKFDNIYTQATKPIEGVGGVYGGVAEFLPYKHEFKRTVEEAMEAKKTEFYFGGTERGRIDDFIEYVWRPGNVITTKSAFFGIDNRVTRDTYMQYLDDTKYSIIIADVEYNENNFITPRPFECWMHDIIGFVDKKFDPDCHLIPADSYLRVSSFKEMLIKMSELKSNPEMHMNILRIQRSMLKPEITSGDYVYSIIK